MKMGRPPRLLTIIAFSLIVLRIVKSQDASAALDGDSGKLKKNEDFGLGGQRQDGLEGKHSKDIRWRDHLSPGESGTYPQPVTTGQPPPPMIPYPTTKNYGNRRQVRSIFSSAGKMMPSYLTVSMLRQPTRSFAIQCSQNRKLNEIPKIVYSPMGQSNSEYDDFILRKSVTNPGSLEYVNYNSDLLRKQRQSEVLSEKYRNTVKSSDGYSSQNQSDEKKLFESPRSEFASNVIPTERSAQTPIYPKEYEPCTASGNVEEVTHSKLENNYNVNDKSQGGERNYQGLGGNLERRDADSKTEPKYSSLGRLTTQFTQKRFQGSRNQGPSVDQMLSNNPQEMRNYERYNRAELTPGKSLGNYFQSNQKSANIKKNEITSDRMVSSLASDDYSMSEKPIIQNLRNVPEQAQEGRPCEDQLSSGQSQRQISYSHGGQISNTHRRLQEPNQQITPSYSQLKLSTQKKTHSKVQNLPIYGQTQPFNTQRLPNYPIPNYFSKIPSKREISETRRLEILQNTPQYLDSNKEQESSQPMASMDSEKNKLLQSPDNKILPNYSQQRFVPELSVPQASIDSEKHKLPQFSNSQVLPNYSQQNVVPEGYSKEEFIKGRKIEFNRNIPQQLDNYKQQVVSEPQVSTDSEKNKLPQFSDSQVLPNYSKQNVVPEGYSKEEFIKGGKIEFNRNIPQQLDNYKQQVVSEPQVSTDSEKNKLPQFSDSQGLPNYSQQNVVPEGYSKEEFIKGRKIEFNRNIPQQLDNYKQQVVSEPQVSTDSEKNKLLQFSDSQVLPNYSKQNVVPEGYSKEEFIKGGKLEVDRNIPQQLDNYKQVVSAPQVLTDSEKNKLPQFSDSQVLPNYSKQNVVPEGYPKEEFIKGGKLEVNSNTPQQLDNYKQQMVSEPQVSTDIEKNNLPPFSDSQVLPNYSKQNVVPEGYSKEEFIKEGNIEVNSNTPQQLDNYKQQVVSEPQVSTDIEKNNLPPFSDSQMLTNFSQGEERLEVNRNLPRNFDNYKEQELSVPQVSTASEENKLPKFSDSQVLLNYTQQQLVTGRYNREDISGAERLELNRNPTQNLESFAPLSSTDPEKNKLPQFSDRLLLPNYTQQNVVLEGYPKEEFIKGGKLEANRNPPQKIDNYKEQELSALQVVKFFEENRPPRSADNQMPPNYSEQNVVPEGYPKGEFTKGGEAECNPPQNTDSFKGQKISVPQVSTDSENKKLPQFPDSKVFPNYSRQNAAPEGYSKGEFTEGRRSEVLCNPPRDLENYREQELSMPQVSTNSEITGQFSDNQTFRNYSQQRFTLEGCSKGEKLEDPQNPPLQLDNYKEQESQVSMGFEKNKLGRATGNQVLSNYPQGELSGGEKSDDLPNSPQHSGNYNEGPSESKPSPDFQKNKVDQPINRSYYIVYKFKIGGDKNLSNEIEENELSPSQSRCVNVSETNIKENTENLQFTNNSLSEEVNLKKDIGEPEKCPISADKLKSGLDDSDPQQLGVFSTRGRCAETEGSEQDGSVAIDCTYAEGEKAPVGQKA